MTDDLVKRLRDLSECAADVAPYVEVAPYESYKAMAQAADRIEELERELREVEGTNWSLVQTINSLGDARRERNADD